MIYFRQSKCCSYGDPICIFQVHSSVSEFQLWFVIQSTFFRRCLRRVSSSSVELESEGEEESSCSPQDSSDLSSRSSTRTTTTSLASLPPDTHNPWLQQCHQTTLHKLKQKSDSSNVVGEYVTFFSVKYLKSLMQRFVSLIHSQWIWSERQFWALLGYICTSGICYVAENL